MNYCMIKKNDIADGPGVRVTLFVSGCTHHCKNCFQPETWNFDYGELFTTEVEDEIIEALKPAWITGLTLLGGEPFEPENQEGLIHLLKRVREELPQKTIWGYSGYTYEQITGKEPGKRCFTPQAQDMLGLLDVLVDGEFVEELKNITLLFRGSENQRLIDMAKTREEGQVILWAK